MEAIISIISIVAPGAVSVLGIIAAILTGAYKFASIINKFRDDKDALVEELRKSDSQYKAQIEILVAQNKEFLAQNKKLTDAIARIKGYSDTIGG